MNFIGFRISYIVGKTLWCLFCNVIERAFILCCVYCSLCVSVLQESMSSAGTPCNPHMKTSVSNSLSEDSCGCVFVPQEGEGTPTICDLDL